MRQFDPKTRKRAQAEAPPLDPIALTLAMWLGLVVGVTGLMRLSEMAAANAARGQDRAAAAASLTQPLPLPAYGS